MGFCCATSPVVAGAIRTRKWPLSRVFVGFNGDHVITVRCAIFLVLIYILRDVVDDIDALVQAVGLKAA